MKDGWTRAPFGIPLTESLCEGLKLSFTPQDFVDAYEADDQVKMGEYRLEIQNALRALPRWVLTYRRKMHEPDFFTEFIPQREKLIEHHRRSQNIVRDKDHIVD